MLINRREQSRWPRPSAQWVGRVAAEHDRVALTDLHAGRGVDARLDRDAAERLRTLDRRLGLNLDQGLTLWPDAMSGSGPPSSSEASTERGASGAGL